MDLFTFKKIVGMLIMPMPFVGLLLVLAVFGFFTQRKKLTTTCAIFALLVFFISTTPMVPDRLLASIEKQYVQFDLSRNVSHIVVLGCGHVNDGTLPITSQIHPCSVIRINEALRLFRANPGSVVVTSGSAFNNAFSNAEMNKRLLVALGVPESQIKTFATPKDTREESIVMSRYLQNKTFALVTSASHMPRSMRLFSNQGLTPLPAPTEHLVRIAEDPDWRYYLPHSNNVRKLERWWYETMGQTWLSIKTWWNA